MVTKTQLGKLTSRIEVLAGAFDPKPVVNVAVFKGETEDFAIQRHRKLRPEHAGMVVRINYRDRERNWAHELFAVYAGATEADMLALKRFLEENDGKECGLLSA